MSSLLKWLGVHKELSREFLRLTRRRHCRTWWRHSVSCTIAQAPSLALSKSNPSLAIQSQLISEQGWSWNFNPFPNYCIFWLWSLRQVGWKTWSFTEDQAISDLPPLCGVVRTKLRYCEPWLCLPAGEHLYQQQSSAVSSPKLSPPRSSPPSPSWSSSPSSSSRACATCSAKRAPSSPTRADQPHCHQHHGRKPRDQDHPVNNINKIWTSCLTTNQRRLMGVKKDQKEQSRQIPGEVFHRFLASLCLLPPQMLFWTTMERFCSTVTITRMVCSGKMFYLAGLSMIKR